MIHFFPTGFFSTRCLGFPSHTTAGINLVFFQVDAAGLAYVLAQLTAPATLLVNLDPEQ
ncbi:MAG: hypothetical protein RBR67_12360 [Desulfobacterium sp.]|nr:hypothetical protein [Desulfobacterium sp.]